MTHQTTALEPLGVELADVDLADLLQRSDDLGRLVVDLRLLLAEHGVIVLREQRIDDAAFTDLLRTFGELVFTEGETPVPGHPDLNVVSNVGRTAPPRSVFHVDTSYVAQPPAYTALRAVSVPAQGGQTLFTDQYSAYGTLDEDTRARLAGRQIRHVVTGVEPGGSQEAQAWHPVFRPHPLTGRTSLYLSTPQRCVEVSGLDANESREVVEHLYAHSTQEQHTLRHGWAAGDVVMWDNGCVMHKADHAGVVGDRVMHRGMVAGYGPTSGGS